MSRRKDRLEPAPESFEPYERNRPIPLVVLWVAIALAMWGAISLFGNSDRFRDDAPVATTKDVQDAEHQQGRGAALFEARCSTCHQPNATGVRDAVPPLAGSAFVAAKPAVMAQVLLHGIDGPIQVAGHEFDGHMPDFSSVLGDADIALLINHVRERWAGAKDTVDAAFVANERQRFGQRGAWQGGAELAARVEPALAPQPAYEAQPSVQVAPAIQRLITDGNGTSWSCASCHGVRGQGAVNVPRLAGLPAAYISKQLRDYASGHRQNENMLAVVKGLSEEEIEGVSQYYAALRAPSNAKPSLGGDLARGEQLALHGDWSKNVPACFSCHGPSGFGVAPEFPALAAQQPEYTAAQLSGWVNGTRGSSQIELMDHIARAMTAEDRRAVADYLATLPPVPAATRRIDAPPVNQGASGAGSSAGEQHEQP